jgi:signal transduction histidine kinase
VFEDLKGDSKDMFLFAFTGASPQNHLIVFDLNFKAISQVNHHYPIRGIKVITNPLTDQNLLFYTFNDQRRVYLQALKYEWTKPLKREDWMFEPIERTDRLIDNPDYEWFANIIPEFIEDIDGDGKQELVCRAWDGFTTNPRGLVVYDLASRKIKWQYLTTTHIATLLFDDFDRDGKKEFILGNIAFKNSRESLNGIDDENGWLVVLDRFGKEQYRNKQFSGYGGVYLKAYDADGDGSPEIYKLISTWGSAETANYIEQMRWDGSHFIRICSYNSESPFNMNQYFFLQEMDNRGTVWNLIMDKAKGLVVLDKNLMPVSHQVKSRIITMWDSEDINLNGYHEILLQTEDDHFILLDHRGHVMASLANPMKGEDNVQAFIVNVGFGMPRQIAIIGSKQLQFYSIDRYPLPVLIYNLLQQYWLVLISLLALVIALAFWQMLRTRQLLFTLSDHSTQGIIVVSGTNRICFINRYLCELLPGSTDVRRYRSLSHSFPELKVIMEMALKGVSYTSQQELHFQNNKFRMVKVIRIGWMWRKHIIMLYPEQIDHPDMQEKLVWADTARRLSHHVRRHITNVLLAIEPIESMCANNTSSRENMHIIRDEINQIKVFTHAFQRFTELKDYDLQPQDIVPSIEHCIARINFPASVTLIKDWSLASVSAFIEPIRFEEALTNLLGNAIEALPEGGTIQLSVKEFPNHSGTDGDLSVLIEVEDSGKGIPPKYLDEIWQPFFTTKQSGTGIGLPETKKIIESMHGTITIQSEDKIGTIVSVWLRGK